MTILGEMSRNLAEHRATNERDVLQTVNPQQSGGGMGRVTRI